ncbi:unnamed protein product [Ostreobium quekettii]|uniref:PPM-type phosphatase domain-containing protein n=1 Tax=Ostreobium quekettii TaxID=121088 RepID=A0A8S1IXE1_9CHLO|nr:unnamed protein product [Ostreobium quekettii]|eukprot:evm.model.scf_1080.3 EVM.evm.TU.scf_1080.3   scf_1080:20574-22185(+)
MDASLPALGPSRPSPAPRRPPQAGPPVGIRPQSALPSPSQQPRRGATAAGRPGRSHPARRAARRDAAPGAAPVETDAERIPISDIAGVSLRGTSRRVNEDRFDYRVWTAEPAALIGCWDGHGGVAVSEWLADKFEGYIDKFWGQFPPEAAVAKAYQAADRKLLAPPSGFFAGMGERGVGGSKCGSTGVTAAIYYTPDGGARLLAANAGDSRVVLVQGGTARQLTTDHVPDKEGERKRIESTNPNPNMPLVRFVGDTWRVGGVLALSRAFGDAYLKGSLQFEGIPAGDDNYSSGFGLLAEPDVSVTELKGKGEGWLVVHTDGLNDTSSRGGGGGLSNDQIAAACGEVGPQGAEALARALAESAQAQGSTDDVTVVCARLDL